MQLRKKKPKKKRKEDKPPPDERFYKHPIYDMYEVNTDGHIRMVNSNVINVSSTE